MCHHAAILSHQNATPDLLVHGKPSHGSLDVANNPENREPSGDCKAVRASPHPRLGRRLAESFPAEPTAFSRATFHNTRTCQSAQLPANRLTCPRPAGCSTTQAIRIAVTTEVTGLRVSAVLVPRVFSTGASPARRRAKRQARPCQRERCH